MKENNDEICSIISGIRHHLLDELYAGVELIACPKDILSQKLRSLQELQNKMGKCRRCALAETRKHIVFGQGRENASLLFVGDIPTEEEDKKGLPFIDNAGQLLTKIIEAIDLKRDIVYVCNSIKCHPPLNRQPTADEIEACKDFLFKQIQLIQPHIICALGLIAGQVLLQSELPFDKLRGKFHRLQYLNNIPVMVTYHPRYLLQYPEKKMYAWEDMKMLKARLELLSK